MEKILVSSPLDATWFYSGWLVEDPQAVRNVNDKPFKLIKAEDIQYEPQTE